jgi:hypothetical protein
MTTQLILWGGMICRQPQLIPCTMTCYTVTQVPALHGAYSLVSSPHATRAMGITQSQEHGGGMTRMTLAERPIGIRKRSLQCVANEACVQTLIRR